MSSSHQSELSRALALRVRWGRGDTIELSGAASCPLPYINNHQGANSATHDATVRLLIAFNGEGIPPSTSISCDCFQMVDPYYEMQVEIHMLIILGPLIAFNLIPSLKLLAPFSAVANVLTFVGLAIVVYYLLTNKKSDAPLDLWGSPATFPLFFGTILFALTAVGVVSCQYATHMKFIINRQAICLNVLSSFHFHFIVIHCECDCAVVYFMMLLPPHSNCCAD